MRLNISGMVVQEDTIDYLKGKAASLKEAGFLSASMKTEDIRDMFIEFSSYKRKMEALFFEMKDIWEAVDDNSMDKKDWDKLYDTISAWTKTEAYRQWLHRQNR